jgi:hypothetical protein
LLDEQAYASGHLFTLLILFLIIEKNLYLFKQEKKNLSCIRLSRKKDEKEGEREREKVIKTVDQIVISVYYYEKHTFVYPPVDFFLFMLYIDY